MIFALIAYVFLPVAVLAVVHSIVRLGTPPDRAVVVPQTVSPAPVECAYCSVLNRRCRCRRTPDPPTPVTPDPIVTWLHARGTTAPDPKPLHTHEFEGQTPLTHMHAGGEQPHGYYGHPENPAS